MIGILHVEGIPGSGKSTASEQLCQLLLARGASAAWYLEESADHPVMPKTRRRHSPLPDFPDICLRAWRQFVASATAEQVEIIDGYALQNTVRYLFANRVERSAIEDYFDAWQAIAHGNSAMIFFPVETPDAHFARLLPVRGAEWTSKLFAYIARTPLGQHERLAGRSGFIRFWAEYQDLCMTLLQRSQIPVWQIGARC